MSEILTNLLGYAIGCDMGTGFEEFHVDCIQGLWIDSGDTVDVLAVIADRPGRGDFSRFVNNLKRRCRRIRFLECNDVISPMLEHLGFIAMEWFHRGELTSGYRWAAP